MERVMDDIKPATAVIASDGKGNGVVLSYTGDVLAEEIEEHGLSGLADLGLDDAPKGISFWEGSHQWVPGGYFTPEEGEFKASGAYRMPTPEEFKPLLFTGIGESMPELGDLSECADEVVPKMIIDLMYSTEIEDWRTLTKYLIEHGHAMQSEVMVRISATVSVLTGFLSVLKAYGSKDRHGVD